MRKQGLRKMNKLIVANLFIGFFFLLFVFQALFVYNMGNDIVQELGNTSYSLAQDPVAQAQILVLMDKYQNLDIKLDYFVFIFFIIFEFSLIYGAVNLVKLPKTQAITYLFFGVLVLMYLGSIIFSIIINLNNILIFEVFLESNNFYFWNYLLSHLKLITFINIVVCVVVNAVFGKEKEEINQMSDIVDNAGVYK